MKHNLIETIMGFVVLTIAGFFLSFAYFSSQLDTTNGYKLTAKFESIEGIQAGSDIRLSGVRIGQVSSVMLDAESYMAVLTLEIEPQIKLPKDSSAKIVSSGLLGSKFVSISIGGDDTYLADNGKIEHTQSAVSLEDMIGQVIFSKKEDEKKS
ncbi:MAG: outer membrane lipid asymmetry maintenance protein MlaD [Alphaproteobacteria bacterium]|nr:outer membrane lipid asymmetry maintenance protein MlaD [Alphaproteobacteria bacterium]